MARIDLNEMMVLAGVMLAIATAIALLGIMLIGASDRSAKRIKAVRSRWGQDAPAKAPLIAARRSETRAAASLLPSLDKLRLRLAKAGLRIGLLPFAGLCLVVGGIAGSLTAGMVGTDGPLPVLVAIAAAAGMPQLLLNLATARRKARFIAGFPPAIDLMVRGLRSGLPLTETFKGVAEEASGPVGREFRHVVASQRLGRGLDDALLRAADRVDVPEFRFFVTALSVQRETGGNLAETLDNLSRVLRSRAQMKKKIKALSAEPKASASILGALPIIMFFILHLVNDGYVSQLFTDPRGHVLVAMGLTSQAIGIAVMARMIRFEI